MESVLRRFGLKKGEQRETEARQKLQRDLFAFSKCTEHGFPSKASAITYDAELDLMALGTRSGALRIYGGPGVELDGQHDDSAAVFHIFMFNQGNVVTVCSDDCLHLWTINNHDAISTLQHVQSLSLVNRVETLSAVSQSVGDSELLVGDETGTVHIVDLLSLQLRSDELIDQQAVIQRSVCLSVSLVLGFVCLHNDIYVLMNNDDSVNVRCVGDTVHACGIAFSGIHSMM